MEPKKLMLKCDGFRDSFSEIKKQDEIEPSANSLIQSRPQCFVRVE